MKIEIGQQAPDFTLYDSDRNKISLSEFRGKNVLLLFFPQAFTSVCTTELCNVRDDINRYQNANAEVLGISVDSMATLNKFKQLEGYNFRLLSDFNKEVSRLYDSIYEIWFSEMRGVSKRSAFIIDKEGVVQYAEVLENASDVPNFEAINRKLEVLNS
jgi:glutaredoxin-dependent peroxiredoxin